MKKNMPQIHTYDKIIKIWLFSLSQGLGLLGFEAKS